MNDKNLEADVWEVVKALSKKWIKEGLTETEAWDLLNLLERADNVEAGLPIKPWEMRQAVIGKRIVKTEDSLAIVALAFHKDPQTVRRWCQAGLVPGAYQTSGGHWRIKRTRQNLKLIAEGIAKFHRQPKSVFRSHRWKRFKKEMLPILTESIPSLFQLDAELREIGLDKFRNEALKEPRDFTLSKFLEVHRQGGKGQCDYLRLRLEARRCWLRGEPPTADVLAQRLRISRRTLFRRFKEGQVMQAINHAEKPLEAKEAICEQTEESDHELIKTITSSTEIPARRKQTINMEKIWNQKHR